ncbi:MAG: acetyl-CoA carboxylase biotin carboxylase subunit [Gaiellales bacterium]|nr:MAG: acetyl-CoA carboxylase biotin carboxylase subunit [Gaiellales bacterium]
MLSKILIANRGEVALRVIRACHELDIPCVAVYSEADSESLHVKEADQAVCIGPGPVIASYLNIPSVIGAAEITGCDAVHPGYGFLSENPEFVEACADNDIAFIGPGPEVMRRMGDKSLAKQTMSEARIPVIPGSEGAVADAAEAARLAGEFGYPVMIKASAGGGGRGMRLVHSPAEIDKAFSMASSEAETAFGDGTIYLEKAITRPHHVEIQVLADKAGSVLTLGERDCSVQRRHQKLIEESPSPLLDQATRQKMSEAGIAACRACGYENAGTVEFLVDDDRNFYFMEMNTRVQVEHPVSEMVTGIDIIREQIRIARGDLLPLTGSIQPRGHAIEMRINAEDPANDFRPNTGKVTRYLPPGGPGVRIDSHLYEGYTIPVFYDSLLAKLLVWDINREAALRRALRALDELVIEGVVTNADIYRDIIAAPDFASGSYTTAFIEENAGRLGLDGGGETDDD